MIVLYARLVPDDDHDAFRVIKNAPLKALAAIGQLSPSEIAAFVQGIDDIKYGRVKSLEEIDREAALQRPQESKQ